MKPEDSKKLETLKKLQDEGFLPEQDVQEALAWAIDKLTPILSATIPNHYPEKHKAFVVKRLGLYFTATPCYGMHSPWWAIQYPFGESINEATTAMRDGDEFWPLTDQLRRDGGP